MTDRTCGQGLAESSVVPARLGEVSAAMAENLEVHMRALDLTDENAKREHEAYVRLASELRTIAGRLQATADEMAGYRDLPMGRHDEQAMSSPDVAAAFTRFVEVEQSLLELLQTRVEQDEAMLAAMSRQTAGGGP